MERRNTIKREAGGVTGRNWPVSGGGGDEVLGLGILREVMSHPGTVCHAGMAGTFGQVGRGLGAL